MFSDCLCAGHVSSGMSPWWLNNKAETGDHHELEAVQDFCPSSCDEIFYITMAFISIVSFLGSTARVGSSIINLRVVQPEDKSASLIILISALSLFALFPSPIVFGALLGECNHDNILMRLTSDQTCDIWGEVCGEATNCQLYNTDKMRQFISWVPAACLFISFLADVGVWWWVGDLELYQEEHLGEDREELEMTSQELEKK